MSFCPVEKEIQCVIHWFQGWSRFHKQDFFKDLLDKAIPCHMDSLFDSMKSMNVNDKPPSIYECQIKLFNQWFEAWSRQERDSFLSKLRDVDPDFVEELDKQISLNLSLQNSIECQNVL